MSRTRTYKQGTLDIQQRFFDVIKTLLTEDRIIGGLSGFCAKYEIVRRHFYAQKQNNRKGYFEVAWILPLIQDFNISADWLLLGDGCVFKNNKDSISR